MCRGVRLDPLLARDRAPDPHLFAQELAQLIGATQHHRDLLSLRELLGDALLPQTARKRGAETLDDAFRGARGRANTPHQAYASKPGKPLSATVGTAASAAVRVLPVCTTPRMVPAEICGMESAVLPTRRSTWPATASFMAGPPPR